MSNFSTPAEVVATTIDVAQKKAANTFSRLFILGIAAGAFIAFGAEASSVAMHTVPDVGIGRLIAGCVFPVGLIMIVIVGGELFTGNCLMVEGLCDKKIRLSGWLRNLIIVYVGNLVGSLAIVAIVNLALQLNYSDAALGAKTIQIAMGKVNLGFSAAFFSGIGCNALVCCAVLGAFAAKDIIGKVFAVFFPIMAFVLSGFEHCVANMYYIPAGIAAAANPRYAEKATELYGYTSAQLAGLDIPSFLVNNLLPVTLGNIVGGVAIGLIFYFAFRAKGSTA